MKTRWMIGLGLGLCLLCSAPARAGGPGGQPYIFFFGPYLSQWESINRGLEGGLFIRTADRTSFGAVDFLFRNDADVDPDFSTEARRQFMLGIVLRYRHDVLPLTRSLPTLLGITLDGRAHYVVKRGDNAPSAGFLGLDLGGYVALPLVGVRAGAGAGGFLSGTLLKENDADGIRGVYPFVFASLRPIPAFSLAARAYTRDGAVLFVMLMGDVTAFDAVSLFYEGMVHDAFDDVDEATRFQIYLPRHRAGLRLNLARIF